MPDAAPRFVPPPGFEHPPELRPSPPRPIPPFIKNGPYMRRRMAQPICGMIGGVGLIILWRVLPASVLELPLFFVIPIGGFGFLGIFFIMLLVRLMGRGPLAYLREGVPLIGQVRFIQFYTFDPQMPRFGCRLIVEFAAPDGTVDRGTVDSGLIDKLERKGQYILGVREGDFITLVRHKDKFDLPLQAYGFLGLNPDYDILRREGKGVIFGRTSASFWRDTVGVILAFVFVFYSLWALERLTAIDFFEDNTALCLGGIFSAICTIGWYLFYRSAQSPEDRVSIFILPFVVLKELSILVLKHLAFVHTPPSDSSRHWRAAKPCVMAFLFGTVGGLFIGMIMLITMNAALDFSAPTSHPITILEIRDDQITTQHGSHILKKVAYQDNTTTRSMEAAMLLVDNVPIHDGQPATLYLKRGFLGWPWILKISK